MGKIKNLSVLTLVVISISFTLQSCMMETDITSIENKEENSMQSDANIPLLKQYEIAYRDTATESDKVNIRNQYVDSFGEHFYIDVYNNTEFWIIFEELTKFELIINDPGAEEVLVINSACPTCVDIDKNVVISVK